VGSIGCWLTGANQPQQQSGQLSNRQVNFLSRRAALGDDLSPSRMKDYALAHTRAVNAGLEVDSPQYFAAVERSVDTMGDGRQPLLDERSAAQICGRAMKSMPTTRRSFATCDCVANTATEQKGKQHER
jgi:hypothetical protein